MEFAGVEFLRRTTRSDSGTDSGRNRKKSRKLKTDAVAPIPRPSEITTPRATTLDLLIKRRPKRKSWIKLRASPITRLSRRLGFRVTRAGILAYPSQRCTHSEYWNKMRRTDVQRKAIIR